MSSKPYSKSPNRGMGTQTTKCLCAMVLVFCMLLSIIPMAYAAESPATWGQELVSGAEVPIVSSDDPNDLGVRADLSTIGSSIPIVVSGQPKASIIYDDTKATDLEKNAANELKDYIKKISGADVIVYNSVAGAADLGTKIYIGDAAPDKAESENAINAEGGKLDSFRILAKGDSIQLNGITDQGTVYACYELLEQLGVRWFMPGDIGTVIPTNYDISLREQDTIQHPAWNIRLQVPGRYQTGMGILGNYDAYEKLPWESHNRLTNVNYAYRQLWLTSFTAAKNPEMFLKDENGKVTNQLDLSLPEVLDDIVNESIKEIQNNPNSEYIHMAPPDGLMYVHNPKPEWDADDYDTLNAMNSATDRFIKFMNLVLDRLTEAGYPNIKIATLAYANFIRPPVREKPSEKLLITIAPIGVDRLHAIGNDLSWERNYVKDLIKAWTDLDVNVMLYDYRFNLADPGLPFSMINQVASEIKTYKELGVFGVKAEVLPAWGYHGPSLYLDAKMKWNPDLDVNNLLTDYFEKFYGPAAKPMREHFDELERALAEADYFAGGVYDYPHILTSDVRNSMEKSLLEAEIIADGDPIYKKRVNMVRVAFDFGDTALKMMESYNNFDFIKAKEQLEEVKALRLKGIEHSPVILFPLAASWYTNWFWEIPINDAYSRVSGSGKIIAQFPDEWDAMLFPNDDGDKIELWNPELETESWMKLKTYSETWSDQGLRYYKGNVWYRTTINIDDKFDDGTPVHLWFGNIDEYARVWVNGQELPVIQKGSSLIKPWVFNASDAVKYGEPNVIVVDVRNKMLDELGTGGIGGPVMFFKPEYSGSAEEEALTTKLDETTLVETKLLKEIDYTVIEDTYSKVSPDGKIIAQLPDEWNAMLFPNDGGDILGLWKPGLGTESFMKLKTYSKTWYDQGLRYYKGNVWYRTTIDIDKKFDDGTPIHLWFGNIDEHARVWMNGKKLRVLKQGYSSMEPWLFDASDAVKYGETNVVVVDVRNQLEDELGTGGIAAPAMFIKPEYDGSNISATYDGINIASGAVVLAGKELVITVEGRGSDSYTYVWSGTGTSGQTADSITINPLTGKVDATCTVSGLKETYEVTFNSNDGSAVSAITEVTSGIAITAPIAPTRAGYTFDGWYKEIGLENAWNFDTDKVTSDITLYAKWVKNTEVPGTYMVTFDVDGVTTNVTVTTGGAIQLPSAPSKDGYTFKGWYTAVSGGTKVKEFRSTMTVYAQWTKNTEEPEIPAPTTTPTPTPVPETKVEEGQVTTTIPVKATTDADGRAVAAISETQLADAIARAAAEAEKQGKKQETFIKIDVKASEYAKTAGIELTAEALQYFVNSEADKLEISTPFGTMTFDDKAASGILKQTQGKISITASKVEETDMTSEIRKKVGDRPVVSFDITGDGKEISQLGGKATVIIPYTLKPGENPNAVVAYYINSKGKLETVINGKYDAKTGTITFKTPHFSKYAVGYDMVDFSDVASNAWYHDAVTFAAARGITSGVGNRSFGSNDNVTRAQALVMIMKAFDISPDTNAKDNFSDAGNTYYTGYLAAAKRLGITGGVGDNKFAPDRQVTRQELFVLVYNTLKNINELPTASIAKDLADFKDSEKVADHAKEAVELFVKTGILSGTNGSILPEDSASRAQFVQILYNVMTK